MHIITVLEFKNAYLKYRMGEGAGVEEGCHNGGGGGGSQWVEEGCHNGGRGGARARLCTEILLTPPPKAKR